MCEKASEAGEAPECPTCFQPLTLQVSRVHGVAEDEDDAGAKPRKKPAAAPRKKKVKQAQSTIDKGLVTLGLKKGRLDPVPDLAASDASDDEGAEERLDALPETAAAGDERRRDAATRDVCVVCLDVLRPRGSKTSRRLVSLRGGAWRVPDHPWPKALNRTSCF